MSIAQGAEIFLTMIVVGGIAGCTVVGVLSLLFEQKLELWEAALLAGFAVSLVGITVSAVGSTWFLLALAANITLGVTVYWLTFTAGPGSAKRLLAQDERRAMAAIDHDFRNAAAHQFLGDICRKQGRYEEAIEQYEIALDQVASLPGEQDLLRRAIKTAERAAADQRRCTQCGEFMARAAAWCPHCGARRTWLSAIVPGDPAEARRFWAIAGLSLAGIVIAGLVDSVLGWWAWLGLVIWVLGLVILLSKPEERIPVRGYPEEVDAQVEGNAEKH